MRDTSPGVKAQIERPDEAAELLRKCLKTGLRIHYEYRSARVDLEALKTGK